MTTPIVAFFNNKGGVGKTSLVYHLAWMYSAELDLPILVADFDPQSSLTALFLDAERLEELWPEDEHTATVYGSIRPLLRGVGDVVERPKVSQVDDDLFLLAGDLALATFEDELSQQWPKCLDTDASQERAFRIL